jgi:integrase
MKVTQDWIKKLKPNGEFQRWDVDGVRGLKLVMHRTGGLSWQYRYTVGKGKDRSFKTVTLGRWPDLSPDTAKTQAENLKELLKKGGDPDQLPPPQPKTVTTEVQPEPELEVTIDTGAKFKPGTYAELAETFYAEWVLTENSTSYARQQRWRLDKFILPALGKLKMEAVGVVAVTKLLDSIKKKSVVNSNRVWTTLNKMQNWGHRRFEVLHRLPNPCTGYEKGEEKPEVARLTEAEIRRLGEAWRVSADPRKYAVLFPLLTGCRRGALLCLDQGVIKREEKVIEWPEDVDGMKGTTKIYVPTSAWPVLDKIPEGVTTEVMAKAWIKLRKAAKVDCSIHDLRRTFASVGTDLGISQHLIEALIHTGGETNKLIKIYQIVGEEKLAETAEKIGAHIAGLLGITQPTTVKVETVAKVGANGVPYIETVYPNFPTA